MKTCCHLDEYTLNTLKKFLFSETRMNHRFELFILTKYLNKQIVKHVFWRLLPILSKEKNMLSFNDA